MTIYYKFTDGKEKMHIYDFEGNELDGSPIENPNPPTAIRDSKGVPIEPDLRKAVQNHMGGNYSPSAYNQQLIAELVCGDIEEGDPDQF